MNCPVCKKEGTYYGPGMEWRMYYCEACRTYFNDRPRPKKQEPPPKKKPKR